MGSYREHWEPSTFNTMLSSAMLILSMAGMGHGFFFRYSLRLASDNKTNSFEERRNFSKPRDTIVGLFDAVTGLTHGLGDVIQDFDVGLDDEKKEEDLNLGSKVVVGLFDSLRQFTKQVGNLVNVVGDRLDDRRGDVVRIAGDVDSQVHNLGQGIRNWKIKTFGFGLKEKSEKKISEDLEIGEDIIVA